MLDFSRLKGTIPDKVYDELLPVLIKYDINTELRLIHFISQCAHESMLFSRVEENFNYSKEGLLKIFKKCFNETIAEEFARKPKLIANKVYANRMGNGDEASGDGWNYRGRGYIQLTGKDNYKAFNTACIDDILLRPELVASKYPLEVAGWFWNYRNLNKLADTGITSETITKITKAINGGTNGLQNRIILFNKFWRFIRYE